jgi:hypothetical protein
LPKAGNKLPLKGSSIDLPQILILQELWIDFSFDFVLDGVCNPVRNVLGLKRYGRGSRREERTSPSSRNYLSLIAKSGQQATIKG